MKNFLLLSVICLILFGCKKDNSKQGANMSAKINGKVWNAATYGALWVGDNIAISGIASDGGSIEINLNDSVEKKYTIESASSPEESLASYAPQDSVPYFSSFSSDAGGEVVVTKINVADSTISGTFAIRLYKDSLEKVVITEGTFTNIPLKKHTIIVNNLFSAKINGTDWTPLSVSGTTGLGKIVLNASDSTSTIEVSFPSKIGLGTFNLSAFGNYTVFYLKGTDMYSSDEGKLIITSHDTENKKIEGTFTAKASNYSNASLTINLSGSFSVTY